MVGANQLRGGRPIFRLLILKTRKGRNWLESSPPLWWSAMFNRLLNRVGDRLFAIVDHRAFGWTVLVLVAAEIGYVLAMEPIW